MIIDELGPAPEEIIPHVPRALSPMVRRIPTEDSLVNTYLIGIDEILVLNPGTANTEHFEAIQGCGGDRLKWVASTSGKKNYSGGKSLLAKELGLTRKNLKPGDVLQSTEFKLTCFCSNGIKTTSSAAGGKSGSKSSGAASGAASSKSSGAAGAEELLFFLEEERVLFCNDILNAAATDTLYKACINLVKKLKPRRIAPAKGQIIEDFGTNLAGHLAELQG